LLSFVLAIDRSDIGGVGPHRDRADMIIPHEI